MKNITKTFVLITVVLGFGTINHASANEHNVEQTLNKVLAAQSKQIAIDLTKQLKQSIKLELNHFAKSNNKPLLKASDNKVVNKSQKNTNTPADE
jgi:hypothetical protein